MKLYKLSIAGIGLLLTLCSLSAMAEDLVKVNSMNYPAWVVRNYQTLPLLPGSSLQANDLIRTGKGGRVLLQFADGSAVKLGESARFIIEATQISETQGNTLFESTFQILRGAFRFTSSFFKTASIGHRAEVKMGAVSIGIRGTDIWGRSNSQQDLVCLIEGVIAVDSVGEATVNMDQALSFYVKPNAKQALPIDQVDMQQLQTWAAETELDATLGIAAEDGAWQLVLISLSDLRNVEQVMQGYHEKGFAAQRKTVQSQGRTLHRLLLPGFITIDAARNARALVRNQLGIDDAWAWQEN